MKTAISISDGTFRAAEKLARRFGLSRSRLYQSAISEFLAKHAERDITEKLNAVYGVEGKAASLSKDVQAMQAKSLPEERW